MDGWEGVRKRLGIGVDTGRKSIREETDKKETW